MRTRSQIILLTACGLSILCSLTSSVPAQVAQQLVTPAASALTGLQLIKQLRSLANGIVDNAGNEAAEVARQVAAQLNLIAGELERALG